MYCSKIIQPNLFCYDNNLKRKKQEGEKEKTRRAFKLLIAHNTQDEQ